MKAFKRPSTTFFNIPLLIFFFILFHPIIIYLIFLPIQDSETNPSLITLPTRSIHSIPPIRCNRTTPNPPLSFTPSLPPLPSTLEQTLASYIAFHKTGRQCLKTHGVDSQCPPVLIWTCHTIDCAGVGDRMMGIQVTFLLAVATKRIFLIDWTEPAALESVLLPAAIDWTLPPALEKRRRMLNGRVVLDVPRLPWFKCEGERNCKVGSEIPDVKELPADVVWPDRKGEEDTGRSMNILKDDFDAVTKHVHVLAIESRSKMDVGYFVRNPFLREKLWGMEEDEVRKGLENLTVCRALMKILFVPSQEVLKSMQKIKTELGKGYDGVHVRLGGDMGEDGEKRFKRFYDDMNKTAGQVLHCFKKVGGGNNVYLATDTEAFKEVFVREANRAGIRVVPGQDRAVHIAKVAGRSLDTHGVCQVFRVVFKEMLVLGSSRTLMGTRSGFADLAMLLGEVDGYFNTMLHEGGNCVKVRAIG